VTRWEHQDVLDDVQEQLERSPNAMRIRRCSIDHLFGIIKSWIGATHFLTKGLEHVKTEMSLHLLAYNVKRLMSLLRVAGMMEAIRAYAFLLDLQRVVRAGTVLIRSVSPKNRHCSLITLKRRTIRIGRYRSTAKACF
jgi:hypothetical protein